MNYNKFHPIALAITVGILSALGTLGAGLFINMILNGKPITAMIGSVYISYNTTVLSSLIASLIAGVNGLIAGYVAAFSYNFLIKYIK